MTNLNCITNRQFACDLLNSRDPFLTLLYLAEFLYLLWTNHSQWTYVYYITTRFSPEIATRSLKINPIQIQPLLPSLPFILSSEDLSSSSSNSFVQLDCFFRFSILHSFSSSIVQYLHREFRGKRCRLGASVQI